MNSFVSTASPDLVIKLDESGFGDECVLAQMEYISGKFKVEKIVKFYSYDSDVKQDFNFN